MHQLLIPRPKGRWQRLRRLLQRRLQRRKLRLLPRPALALSKQRLHPRSHLP
jgi:hypothetical protein